MKKITLITLLFFTAFTYSQIGINTDSPDASAALDVVSTTGGILIPRLTETQRDAIGNPATGLMIYQKDQDPGFYFYNGNEWQKVSAVSYNDLSNKPYGGWYQNPDSDLTSEITVGNLMFRKNTNNNYLEVKEVSNADHSVIAINDPFDSGNNYSRVGGPSGGAQYNTSEWKSIVQVYDFDAQNYSGVPESLSSKRYNIREYEILESDNSYRATTLKKYKVREYFDGYSNYVYTVEYIDFY